MFVFFCFSVVFARHCFVENGVGVESCHPYEANDEYEISFKPRCDPRFGSKIEITGTIEFAENCEFDFLALRGLNKNHVFCGEFEEVIQVGS